MRRDVEKGVRVWEVQGEVWGETYYMGVWGR